MFINKKFKDWSKLQTCILGTNLLEVLKIRNKDPLLNLRYFIILLQAVVNPQMPNLLH